MECVFFSPVPSGLPEGGTHDLPGAARFLSVLSVLFHVEAVPFPLPEFGSPATGLGVGGSRLHRGGIFEFQLTSH